MDIECHSVVIMGWMKSIWRQLLRNTDLLSPGEIFLLVDPDKDVEMGR